MRLAMHDIGSRSWFAGLVVSLCLAAGGASAEPTLRDPGLFFEPVPAMAVPVDGTRILIKDLALIRSDFASLQLKTPREIDQILNDCAGYMTESQTMNHFVSETIPIDPKRPKIEGFKPKGYGRALILKCLEGLIDTKGSGSLAPGMGRPGHSNGLMGLGEALREYIFEKMMRIILRHAGYAPGTVGIYAVMDLNFNVYFNDGPMRAALVLRQARGRLNAMGRLPKEVAEHVEFLIRRYGIVSDVGALSYEYQTIDRQNVQGASNGALIDAGGVRIFPGLLKQSPSQPDPALRLPFEIWGYSERGDPKDRDNMFLLATHWAKEWMAGRMTEAQIDAEVEGLLKPLREKYKNPCAGAMDHSPNCRVLVH